MPRALTAEWQEVLPPNQPEAASRWRARRDVLTQHGCHHWIFRSPSNPDTFLEFIEGANADAVARARAVAGLEPSAEILIELELS